MSKAQTDIRCTSYDARYANPHGWQGDIEEVLVQLRNEPNIQPTISVRESLLMYLGVNKTPSVGPSVEMDESPRYGEEPSAEPGFYSLDYAAAHWPETFCCPVKTKCPDCGVHYVKGARHFSECSSQPSATVEAPVRHAATCKLFPDPFDERDPVGPCTCGATSETEAQPSSMDYGGGPFDEDGNEGPTRAAEFAATCCKCGKVDMHVKYVDGIYFCGYGCS